VSNDYDPDEEQIPNSGKRDYSKVLVREIVDVEGKPRGLKKFRKLERQNKLHGRQKGKRR
jgi:hypothetical protein